MSSDNEQNAFDGAIGDSNSDVPDDVTGTAEAVTNDSRNPNRRRLKLESLYNEFKFGAQTVYANYLDYVYQYGIVCGIKYISPVILAIVLGQTIGINVLFLPVYCLLATATSVAASICKILHLPTDMLLLLVVVLLKLITTSIGFLPSSLAIFFIGILVPIENIISVVIMHPVTLLTAVMFFQPIMDELHYRYFVDKLLTSSQSRPNIGIGGEIGARLFSTVKRRRKKSRESSSNASQSGKTVQLVQVDSVGNKIDRGGEGEGTDKIGDDDAISQLSMTESNNTATNPTTAATAMAVASSEARQIWLKFQSGIAMAAKSCSRVKVKLPVVTPSNISIWLSSFLIATCHLNWLRVPDSYFFSGFLKSILSLLSDLSPSELQPILSTIFLALALHQALVTYLVSLNVFTPIYKDRGIVAAMGAHVMWSVGIIILPFRIFGKTKEYIQAYRQRQPSEGDDKKKELPSLPW